MLIEQKHFPHGSGGTPWGAILIVAVVIVGITYTGYKLTETKPGLNSKSNENEEQ